MTDKQIIIDGVDVSGCYQYMSRYMEDYDIDTVDYCKYNFKPCKDIDVKFCYYKQLKRKEQELEQYKKSKQASYEALQKRCNELELKNRKLEQVLQEIKEWTIVLQNICPSFIKDGNDSMVILGQILQKCNEVLDENRLE